MITLGENVLIHDFKRQGLSVSAIARKLGLDRKTVRKHLEVAIAPPAYSPRAAQPRLIAPFEAYLRARITAWPDLSGKRLLREIKERGYSGCYSVVNGLPSQRATATGPALRTTLRDRAGQTGAGRLRPVPGGVQRRARGRAHPVAVHDRSRCCLGNGGNLRLAISGAAKVT